MSDQTSASLDVNDLDDNQSLGEASVDSQGSQSLVEKSSQVDPRRKDSNSSSVTSFSRRRHAAKEKARMTMTTLVFHWLNGEKLEKELSFRPCNYSELQREIARLTPRSQAMFAVQYLNGEKVFPVNFKESDRFAVREIRTKAPARGSITHLGEHREH